MAKIVETGDASQGLDATQAKINALLIAARAAKQSGNTTLAKQKLAAANAIISKSATNAADNVSEDLAYTAQSIADLNDEIAAQVDEENAAINAEVTAPATIAANESQIIANQKASNAATLASDAMEGFINFDLNNMPTFDETGTTPTTTVTDVTPTTTVASTTPTATVTSTTPKTTATSTTAPAGPTVVGQYTDAATGDIVAVYSNGSTHPLSYGTTKADTEAANLNARQSAYDLLYNEFNKYGLGTLVEGIKGLIKENVSPSEFAIRLQNTDAYKQRFAANQDRIKKGLRALTPAEYIGLEDQYQNIMRNYGLPASYYAKGDLGVQEGLNKFIANDVSPAELEDRIATAQKRIIYANPEVGIALKTFYPDISNGDLLAYALDPDKALEQIKRRITAAEIGSSAVQLGLTTNVTDAEYLARYGVTKEQAQQGYRQVAEVLPTASKLGDIYAAQGLGPYTQQTAEQEVFNVPGAAEAAAKRRKLSQLEQATFGGSSGTAQGALARDRAGAF